jgi:peptide/nickel transport system permease protein
MTSYIVRRVLYAIPILMGVNAITFALFFVVNPPERMARRILGEKNVTPEMIEKWKRQHGYHLPTLVNREEHGFRILTQTIFYQKALPLLWFDFGRSDATNEGIGDQIRERMGPSLAYTVPNLVLGLYIGLTISMIIAYLRGTYFDFWALVISVAIMSIPGLFFIIWGQYFFGKLLRLAPVSGFGEGWTVVKSVALPIIIGILSSLGGGLRFNRIIFLEELGKDYIRTARSKGLAESDVLLGHGLRNALIPILTSTVAALPFLFYGGLMTETFFGIPGLGDYMINAIYAQDFAIVRSMVYLGAVLTIVGYILADVSCCIADPRIRLE